MSKELQTILLEIVRQLFGVQIGVIRRRSGKIILTPYTVRKMLAYRIDGETLENAFRFGIEYRTGKIIHRYSRHIIGLYYKASASPIRKDRREEKSYVITTCWKGR